ncbi:hypothetical protein [Funiculus sociatus]
MNYQEQKLYSQESDKRICTPVELAVATPHHRYLKTVSIKEELT